MIFKVTFAEGIPGTNGAPGSQGIQGVPGANGTNGTNGTNATVSTGTTTTGAAGSSASVTNSGTSTAAVFNFTIPKGDQGNQGIQGVAGTNGTNGTNGANGATGAAGPNNITTSTTTNINGILRGDGSTVSAAIAANFPTLNQNTTGTAANVTGVVPLLNGGTGVAATSNAVAFNTLAPTSTVGDMIYTSTSGNVRLPVGTVGQFLTAQPGSGSQIPTWSTISARATQVFSGTGATNNYTMSQSVASTALIDVFVFGVYQQKSTYSVSGTTLTFSEFPPTGTNNIEVVYASTLSTGISTPTASDIEVTDSTKGLILRSPNNSRWRVQVTNAGALTVTLI